SRIFLPASAVALIPFLEENDNEFCKNILLTRHVTSRKLAFSIPFMGALQISVAVLHQSPQVLLQALFKSYSH
ncbi:MAG: hypothetical protein JXA35_09095, partial [Deltaproteobacteria bacterium]|nr:hypothetical protein [Deltaproteobacteria bacterium]